MTDTVSGMAPTTGFTGFTGFTGLSITAATLTILTLGLGGCQVVEMGQKMLEVIKDPEVQVGDDGDQASLANITFFAQRNANLNLFGESVPISVIVAQMRADVALSQADILEFMGDVEASLGKDYIDSSEHSIPPGAFLTLDPIELDSETKYLGFAALFADTQGATWQVIEAVEPVGKTYTVTVEVADKNLRATLEAQ